MLTPTLIRLEYKGQHYIIPDTWTDHNILGYCWNEGNWSCDCNRSSFIKQYCDPSFPVLPCGDNIKLVEIEE